MPINLPCLLPSSLDISNIFVVKKELSCNSLSFLFFLSKYIQITLKKFWPHRSNVKGFSIKDFASQYRDKISKLSSDEISSHYLDDGNLNSIGKDDNYIDTTKGLKNKSHWANRDFSEYRNAA